MPAGKSSTREDDGVTDAVTWGVPHGAAAATMDTMIVCAAADVGDAARASQTSTLRARVRRAPVRLIAEGCGERGRLAAAVGERVAAASGARGAGPLVAPPAPRRRCSDGVGSAAASAAVVDAVAATTDGTATAAAAIAADDSGVGGAAAVSSPVTAATPLAKLSTQIAKLRVDERALTVTRAAVAVRYAEAAAAAAALAAEVSSLDATLGTLSATVAALEAARRDVGGARAAVGGVPQRSDADAAAPTGAAAAQPRLAPAAHAAAAAPVAGNNKDGSGVVRVPTAAPAALLSGAPQAAATELVPAAPGLHTTAEQAPRSPHFPLFAGAPLGATALARLARIVTTRPHEPAEALVDAFFAEDASVPRFRVRYALTSIASGLLGQCTPGSMRWALRPAFLYLVDPIAPCMLPWALGAPAGGGGSGGGRHVSR